MNLLIVDDEPMALEEIREVVLEVKNDVCVKCCDNYMDALENAKIKKYDVAFLDISMPCMNGLEIAKNLKDINKNTNIVFITGYSEYAVEAFSISASAVGISTSRILSSIFLSSSERLCSGISCSI